MVWLPEGDKSLRIRSLVSTEYTNVTDRQTDRQIPDDDKNANKRSK